jgi:hypothetical protein
MYLRSKNRILGFYEKTQSIKKTKKRAQVSLCCPKCIYFKRGSISILIITDYYFTTVTVGLKRNDVL